MTKAVAKKQNTEVATVAADAFGSAGGIEDIVIPKIMVMQKMSKLLDTNDDLKVGDFVESLGETKVGSISEGLDFIPFYMEKLWFRSQKVGKDFEFLAVEGFNQSNARRRYSEVVDGVEYKNELHMKFYAVLPDDPSIPYAITFKGTSQKTGKALYTQMYVKNKMSGLSAAGKVMTLAGAKQENEKGTFVVLNTTVARNSTAEEVQMCLDWFHTIESGNASTASDAPESVQAKEAAYADNNAQF